MVDYLLNSECLCIFRGEGMLSWGFEDLDNLFRWIREYKVDSKKLIKKLKEHSFLPNHPDAYNKAFILDEFHLLPPE